MKPHLIALANQCEFAMLNSLGKGEVVSSILTGSTIILQALSTVSCQAPRDKRSEPVMNKSATTREKPPSSSNKTSGDGWQPIETAPKDGTPIDIWCGGFRYCDAYWDDKEQAWCTEDGEVPIRHIFGIEPRHWMPIPGNPADVTEDDFA